MKQYIISIVLGILPEVLYFTYFLIYTKNLKEKKLKLGIGIFLVYVLCLLIKKYVLINYVAFIILIYWALKFLYKEKVQIVDVFVFSISTIYLTIISYIMSKILYDSLDNYYLLFVVNRIVMFIPFLFRNKFHILYRKYCYLWNRNDKEKRPIKSITLRGISNLFLATFIIVINIVCLYISKFN